MANIKSSQTTRLQYHYSVSIFVDGKEIHDINYCTFMRNPLLKTATYCIIRCSISQLIAREIQDQITHNKFPEVKLKIYTLDNESTFGDERIKLLFDQLLICTNIKIDRELRFTTNNIHVNLLLVHPILKYMDDTNVYNIYHNPPSGITAAGVLLDYENWIKTNYGDMFNFVKIGFDELQNDFRYEQILVKTPNDLSVPNYLISTYKINHSPSLYFFDSFTIGENVSNEVTALYMNLYSLKKSKTTEVRDYSDKRQMTKVVKHIPFNDNSRKYNKTGNRFIFQTYNIKYDHHKDPQSTQLPKMKSKTIDNIKFPSSDRVISGAKSGSLSTKQIGQSSTFSRIYVPDNISNAQKRFDIGIEMFNSKIKDIYYAEVSNGQPDYPEWGKRYDLLYRGEYKLAPLSMCSCFIRKNAKESHMKFMNKIVFVEFE